MSLITVFDLEDLWRHQKLEGPLIYALSWEE